MIDITLWAGTYTLKSSHTDQCVAPETVPTAWHQFIYSTSRHLHIGTDWYHSVGWDLQTESLHTDQCGAPETIPTAWHQFSWSTSRHLHTGNDWYHIVDWHLHTEIRHTQISAVLRKLFLLLGINSFNQQAGTYTLGMTDITLWTGTYTLKSVTQISAVLQKLSLLLGINPISSSQLHLSFITYRNLV